MTLGLARGVVRLAEHDAKWADEFRDEHARLSVGLGDAGCEIEHVGSTAVRGLRAKPILDIALGYPTHIGLVELRLALERAGYEYRGDSGEEGGHVFVRGFGSCRTHHLHAVPLDGAQWMAYLRFRDLLRADAKARHLYASAKAELAARFEFDRKSYTDGKAALIQRLLTGSY